MISLSLDISLGPAGNNLYFLRKYLLRNIFGENNFGENIFNKNTESFLFLQK